MCVMRRMSVVYCDVWYLWFVVCMCVCLVWWSLCVVFSMLSVCVYVVCLVYVNV